MRIAYVITRADEIGGAQVHVRDLASAVHAAGHEVTVLGGAAGALSEQLGRRGVPFELIPDLVRPIAPRRDLAAFRQLTATLERLRPELVTTHSSKAGWLGRLAARRLGLPVIFTAHGWAFTEGVPRAQRALYGLAERLAAPLADHIITVSEHDRALALARRIAAPHKITCIHNGVHDAASPGAAHQASGPVRLLMLGRFSPQKDHPGLLRALAGLPRGAWLLDLAGEGPDQARIAALAAELGIAPYVHVLGPRDDIVDLLRRSHLYVLVSHWEGLPYSILEAMSAGIPVVASDVGGVREAVGDGVSGILVPRGDVPALRTALAALIGDPARRRQLGMAARRRYETAFRFERMLTKTFALYEQVAAAGAARRPQADVASARTARARPGPPGTGTDGASAGSRSPGC